MLDVDEDVKNGSEVKVSTYVVRKARQAAGGSGGMNSAYAATIISPTASSSSGRGSRRTTEDMTARGGAGAHARAPAPAKLAGVLEDRVVGRVDHAVRVDPHRTDEVGRARRRRAGPGRTRGRQRLGARS